MFKNPISWIPAADPGSLPRLNDLERRMQSYYANVGEYYESIDFSSTVWDDATKLPQQDILNELERHEHVLEVGCGRANILKGRPSLSGKYTGIEFSRKLIRLNQQSYPGAQFSSINESTELPFPNAHFDFVFSHFVIEHVVRPDVFLHETMRVLKTGGMLVIICPDFLGRSFIPSQRVGLSQGTGKRKLRQGKVLDALLTACDTKFRIPYYCRKYRGLANKRPRFYVNANPTCFIDPFAPDVDAVYLTYAKEMKDHCGRQVSWIDSQANIRQYCADNGLIYLKGIRK